MIVISFAVNETHNKLYTDSLYVSYSFVSDLADVSVTFKRNPLACLADPGYPLERRPIPDSVLRRVAIGNLDPICLEHRNPPLVCTHKIVRPPRLLPINRA